MFLKWLTLCFYRTELNAPLPPLAAHVATPDGTHQESVQLKTDQPPCQLMRPRRINNRVETDSYFSLYWLYNDKYIILCLKIVDNTLHSSVNGLLLIECMCLCTRPTSQGGSLVCGSMSSCKTEVWCWQAQFSSNVT